MRPRGDRRQFLRSRVVRGSVPADVVLGLVRVEREGVGRPAAGPYLRDQHGASIKLLLPYAHLRWRGYE